MKIIQKIFMGVALGVSVGSFGCVERKPEQINELSESLLDQEKTTPALKDDWDLHNMSRKVSFSKKEVFTEFKNLSNSELALLFVRTHYDWMFFPNEKELNFEIVFGNYDENRKKEIKREVEVLDNEIREVIKQSSDSDCIKALTDSMSKSKNLVLMVGDNHLTSNDDESFFQMVVSMHEANQLEAIGLELPYTLEKEVNSWLKGESSIDIFPLLENEIGSTLILSNSYKELLEKLKGLISKNPEIRVICFDSPKKERNENADEREQFMFSQIKAEFLDRNPKKKIAIYVGALHIEKLRSEDKFWSDRFCNLLSEYLKTSSQNVISVLQEHRITPYRQVWHERPLGTSGIWTEKLPIDFYSRGGHSMQELYDYLISLN